MHTEDFYSVRSCQSQVKGITLSRTCKVSRNTPSNLTQENVHVPRNHDRGAGENVITHLTQMLSIPGELGATIENSSSQGQS